MSDAATPDSPIAHLRGELPTLALSARELDTLRLIAAGHTNRGVGTVLGISHQTVKQHVTMIFRKLKVRTRIAAVALAMREGWIE